MAWNRGAIRIIDPAKFKLMRTHFGQWPEYVLEDWVNSNTENSMNSMLEFHNKVKDDHGDPQRIKFGSDPALLNFTWDKLNPKTQYEIQSREGGTKNPKNLPGDEERHQTQHSKLKGKNAHKDIIIREPVIMLKKSDGWELVEGFHRLTQAFKLYPNGFKGYAFLGRIT